jgi:hypothetical protein
VVQVVHQKYISPETIEDWIRSPQKTCHNVYVIWKVVVLSFPLIGGGLVWNIGDGSRVQLGEDPWVGSDIAHTLLVI